MRVIGYIDTKGYKTTVFKNNDRFIVKFESDLFEQTFKFRESDKIAHLEHLKELLDRSFLMQIEERFLEMYESSNTALMRYQNAQEEEWEEII